MSKSEHRARVLTLLQQQRWAALATFNDDGSPEASMVAYAMGHHAGEIYLHLSELAPHTRNLMQSPRLALAISEPDTGEGDPQRLARATLYGRAEPLEPGDTDYATARSCYLSRLPTAQRLFDFGDFHLFRLHVDTLRFVGGFGQAFTISSNELGQT